MNATETKQKINSVKAKRELYSLAKECGAPFTAAERKQLTLGGLKWELGQKLGFDLFENLNK